MGQITQQIFFNASVEKVWKIWTDVEKTPEWVEGVSESRITSPVREGKGLAWDEKCLFGKKEIQMGHQFVEFDREKKTRTETGLPMGGTMETIAEFRVGTVCEPPLQQTTEVTIQLEWDLGIVGAMIGDDKLQHMMEKSFNLTVEKWKSKAEGA